MPLDAARGTSGAIRPLHSRDIPALVALRRLAFRHSERATPDALASFFRGIFFESPWRDPQLPSLVYEDGHGDVIGFLGIVPRRMTLNGRAVRVAVGTQLMVAPGSTGLVGRRLARAFFDGPQDLCVGDAANDAARRLWLSLGGYVSPMLSLCWVRRLRPWRHAMLRLGASRAARALRGAAAPLARLLDVAMAGTNLRVSPREENCRLEPLTPDLMHRELDTVLRSFALRPRYDAASTAWLLDRAAEKKHFGPLHSALVRARNGDALGWFLYHLDDAGIANVLQIAARRSATEDVLRCLYRDAWNRDAVAVGGRAEPWMMSAVVGSGDAFAYQGPWTLLHSRDPDIVNLIERGDGYLSRLDGEWWLSF
jgi:hypothetical protein